MKKLLFLSLLISLTLVVNAQRGNNTRGPIGPSPIQPQTGGSAIAAGPGITFTTNDGVITINGSVASATNAVSLLNNISNAVTIAAVAKTSAGFYTNKFGVSVSGQTISLNMTQGIARVSPEDSSLIDNSGTGSANWNTRTLSDNNGPNNSLNWNTRELLSAADDRIASWDTSFKVKGTNSNSETNYDLGQIFIGVTNYSAVSFADRTNYRGGSIGVPDRFTMFDKVGNNIQYWANHTSAGHGILIVEGGPDVGLLLGTAGLVQMGTTAGDINQAINFQYRTTYGQSINTYWTSRNTNAAGSLIYARAGLVGTDEGTNNSSGWGWGNLKFYSQFVDNAPVTTSRTATMKSNLWSFVNLQDEAIGTNMVIGTGLNSSNFVPLIFTGSGVSRSGNTITITGGSGGSATNAAPPYGARKVTASSDSPTSADYLIVLDTTANAITEQLPSCTTVMTFRFVKETGANIVSIIPASGQAMNGVVDAGAYLTNNGDYVTITCTTNDVVGWWISSRNDPTPNQIGTNAVLQSQITALQSNAVSQISPQMLQGVVLLAHSAVTNFQFILDTNSLTRVVEGSNTVNLIDVTNTGSGTLEVWSGTNSACRISWPTNWYCGTTNLMTNNGIYRACVLGSNQVAKFSFSRWSISGKTNIQASGPLILSYP